MNKRKGVNNDTTTFRTFEELARIDFGTSPLASQWSSYIGECSAPTEDGTKNIAELYRNTYRHFPPVVNSKFPEDSIEDAYRLYCDSIKVDGKAEEVLPLHDFENLYRLNCAYQTTQRRESWKRQAGMWGGVIGVVGGGTGVVLSAIKGDEIFKQKVAEYEKSLQTFEAEHLKWKTQHTEYEKTLEKWKTDHAKWEKDYAEWQKASEQWNSAKQNPVEVPPKSQPAPQPTRDIPKQSDITTGRNLSPTGSAESNVPNPNSPSPKPDLIATGKNPGSPPVEPIKPTPPVEPTTPTYPEFPPEHIAIMSALAVLFVISAISAVYFHNRDQNKETIKDLANYPPTPASPQIQENNSQINVGNLDGDNKRNINEQGNAKNIKGKDVNVNQQLSNNSLVV